MRHGFCSQTRFIGKGSPANTLANDFSSDAPCNSLSRESVIQDERQHNRKLGNIFCHNRQAGKHIDQYHQGYHPPGHQSDPGNTPKDHRSHNYPNDCPNKQVAHHGLFDEKLVGNKKTVPDELGQLISLEHGQAPNQSGSAEQDRQGFKILSQPCFNHIHGTALDLARIVLAAKKNSQSTGKKFCRHTHHGTDPHPEQGTRPTHIDRHRHTADITHPHCSSQGTGQSLEMINLTGVISPVILTQ